MKILVLSDSHNMLADAETAIEKHGCEYIIFLGDVAEDAEMLRKACQRRYQFAKISVLEMRGLASFYAGDRGLILAY